MTTQQPPLHCPACNAYLGRHVWFAQEHHVSDHPDEDIPTPEEIIEYSALVRLKYRLRNIMAPLAPEEAFL